MTSSHQSSSKPSFADKVKNPPPSPHDQTGVSKLWFFFFFFLFFYKINIFFFFQTRLEYETSRHHAPDTFPCYRRKQGPSPLPGRYSLIKDGLETEYVSSVHCPGETVLITKKTTSLRALLQLYLPEWINGLSSSGKVVPLKSQWVSQMCQVLPILAAWTRPCVLSAARYSKLSLKRSNEVCSLAKYFCWKYFYRNQPCT